MEDTPEKIEQDHAEKERTLRALAQQEAIEKGSGGVAPEHLQTIQKVREEIQEQGDQLSAERYDNQVAEILAEVIALEHAFEFTLKKGLTEKKLRMLHDGLDDAQERLQKLDEQIIRYPARSKERRSLITLIDQLRRQYPANMQQISPHEMFARPLTLSGVQQRHLQAKAQYASVQHLLPEDQRRVLRTRLTGVGALVRHAEAMNRASETSVRIAKAVLDEREE